MSKQDLDKKFADEELVDVSLRQVYQSLKAEHPLPSSVKQQIRRQAKHAVSQHNWRSWWYFSQLALGCAALVLVLSWVNPAKLPAYYQIDTITSAATGNNVEAKVQKVQWHHLTASVAAETSAAVETSVVEKSIVQQRLSTLKQQQREFQQAGEQRRVLLSQVGLLTQHDDKWQIAMCDNLQLNVAIELVHELRAQMNIEPRLQPQWVELQFTPTGHILAIATLPATMAARQCPTPQRTVVQQQS